MGKSSLLNMIAGQDVAIISSVPGTTTDVVEKTMELLPVGPVVFLDTAGLDDKSVLAESRLKKTDKIFDRSDIILLLVEPDVWTEYEDYIVAEAKKVATPLVIIVNKVDLKSPSISFVEEIRRKTEKTFLCSSIDYQNRDQYVNSLKKHLVEIVPPGFHNSTPLDWRSSAARGTGCLDRPHRLRGA